MVSGLGDPAVLHHDDVVGEAPDDVRSWVMSISAMPNFAFRSLSRFQDLRLHGDVERGRRLVGDERSGGCASAIAIITRWRWPPESWCG